MNPGTLCARRLMPRAKTSKLFRSITFISVFLFALSLQGFADETPSLAILSVTPVKAEASKASIVYGYIVDKVHKSGSYALVERKEIDKALDEIELSANNLVDNKTAIRVGKFTGARYVLVSSLTLEEGIYYLSMRVIETETARVSETTMKSASDFKKVEDLVTQSVGDLLSVKSRAMEIFSTAGLRVGVPVPIASAGDFLNLAVEPSAWYGYNLDFSWGTVILGIGVGFDFFGVKGQPANYVMNFPVALKAEYAIGLGNFYLFAGVKGGAAASFYKAATISDVKAGLVPFVSPEIGAGYRIMEWLDVYSGAGFDMIIFSNGDIQMSVNPFLGSNIRFQAE